MATNIIQNNFFLGAGSASMLGGNTGVNSLVPRHFTPEVKDVVGNFFKGFETGFAQGFMDGLKDGLQGALKSPSCPCEPPQVSDSGHPQGSLTVGKDGVVTTPGGYKIEATNQYEWKVTGPDGKETRVWGDPHVDLGNDGGKGGNGNDFEFKRPTTFVLGDGTKINVSVQPYNNMTVTNHLQILSGNDRVEISDIDKGKGTVSAATQDGYAHTNDFGKNDVFVQGKDVTEWSFQGKKILGSENGGESFKLGEDLKPITDVPKRHGGAENWASEILKSVTNLMKDMMPLFSQKQQFPGSNPYNQQDNNGSYNRDNHLRGLGNAFQQVGNMLKIMSDLAELTQQLNRKPMYTAY